MKNNELEINIEYFKGFITRQPLATGLGKSQQPKALVLATVFSVRTLNTMSFLEVVNDGLTEAYGTDTKRAIEAYNNA